MAKKTSREHTEGRQALFSKLRNKIRSSGTPKKAIEQLKASTEPKVLFHVAGMFAKHPAYQLHIWPDPFPKDLSKSSKSIFPFYVGLENELAWAVSLLNAYADEITDFLDLKKTLEETCLYRSDAEMASMIASGEERFGESLWLIGHKINHLTRASGATAKAQYVRSLTARNGMPTALKQIISWLSYRSAADVSNKDIDRLLSSIAPPDNGVNVIIHLLLGWTPIVTPKVAAQVLAYCDILPAIDRYLILVHLLRSICVSDMEKNVEALVVPYVMALGEKVDDPFLHRIAVCLQSSPMPLQTDAEITRLTDVYIEGDYSRLRAEAKFYFGNSIGIDVLNLVVRSCYADGFDLDIKNYTGRPESIIADIAECLHTMLAFGSKSNDARAKLLKYVTAFAGCSWASSLALLLLRHENDERIFRPTPKQTMHALAASENQLLSAFAFPQKAQVAYAQSIAWESYKTSSSVRIMAAVLEGSSEFPWQRYLPPERAARLKAIANARRGGTALAISELEACLEELSTLVNRETAILLVRAFLQCDCLLESVKLTSRLFVSSAFFGNILPIEEIVDALMLYHDEPLSTTPTRGEISTAIVFDIYSRYVSSDKDAERADAFKDVLKRRGINHISQIQDASSEPARDQLEYFLRSVCVPEVLDQSLSLPTTRAVEDERVAILVRLSEMTSDPERSDAALKEELREIRTRQVVRETSLRLDQSKIYVNTEGLKRVMDISLRDNWNRYRLMIAEDAGDTRLGDLERIIKAALGERAHVVTINTPYTDRSVLLQKILSDVVEQFTFNKEFGLNSNLSTNIRHGYVLRELRAPLLSKALVTNKSSDAESYNYNEFWLAKVSESDAGLREGLNRALTKFSQRVDDVIERLNRELLRIRSDSTPNGLFSYELAPIISHSTENFFAEISDYDGFVQACLDTCWSMTDACLSRVRRVLSDDILTELNDALDHLEGDLSQYNVEKSVQGLDSAVSMARPDIRSAVERVKSWFTLSGNNEYQDFDFEIPYQGGLQTIKTYYSDVDIIGVYSSQGPLILRGRSLPVFNRLLFLLLDNAAEHSSGIIRRLEVSVAAEVWGDVFCLKVANKLPDEVDHVKLSQTVKHINDRYGQAGQNELFALDKGTGFAKIWKLLKFDLQREHALHVYVDNTQFCVEIMLSAPGVVVG